MGRASPGMSPRRRALEERPGHGCSQDSGGEILTHWQNAAIVSSAVCTSSCFLFSTWVRRILYPSGHVRTCTTNTPSPDPLEARCACNSNEGQGSTGPLSTMEASSKSGLRDSLASFSKRHGNFNVRREHPLTVKR